jgi:hypothetical protein
VAGRRGLSSTVRPVHTVRLGRVWGWDPPSMSGVVTGRRVFLFVFWVLLGFLVGF